MTCGCASRTCGEIRRARLPDYAEELVEDSGEQAGLGLGGGMLEVRDGGGRVLYRSARLGATQLGADRVAGPAMEN